ncbi:hypothetical protein WDZ92_34260, partial [Nostoc sp. NIES-2111]
MAIVGQSAFAMPYVATNIGNLGGNVQVVDVNGRGEVIGSSVRGDGSIHAILYSEGSLRDLDPNGATNSRAQAISENGRVMGTVSVSENQSGFVVFGASGPRSLGVLDNSFSPGSINSRGDVAASTYGPRLGQDYIEKTRAFVAREGQAVLPIGPLASWTIDMNEAGVVLGDSNQRAGVYAPRSFLTGVNGNSISLTSLGGTESRGYDLNNRGQVTGESQLYG